MHYFSLYAFHFVYFIVIGISTFIPKYYGELGFTGAQIGLLTSIPTIAALMISPRLSLLADRASRKRNVLLVLLLLLSAFYFGISRFSAFVPILVLTCFSMTCSTTAQPLNQTITLEYVAETGKKYGPIRLVGTLGYQAGALLIGLVLTTSLKNMYPLMTAVTLIACSTTLMMPNIAGHQHGKKKIPYRRLFADRQIVALYVLIFFCTIPSQFYQSFYSKHLGDLGMSNASVSAITLLSVILEIPFLFFGDRIYKKTNVWNWLLIGMICNGLRWLGLCFCGSNLLLNIIFQFPGVTVLACFEFFPALYLTSRVAPELDSSAQNMLSLTTFGFAKVLASLLGGILSDYVGIPVIFCANGVMMIVGAIALLKLTRTLIRADAA